MEAGTNRRIRETWCRFGNQWGSCTFWQPGYTQTLTGDHCVEHYLDRHDRFHCRHNSACPLAGPNELGGFILTTALGIAGAFVATFIGQTIGWYRLDQGAGRQTRSRETRTLRHAGGFKERPELMTQALTGLLLQKKLRKRRGRISRRASAGACRSF
jgi:hypothetical protein